jgi:hypothetical protein
MTMPTVNSKSRSLNAVKKSAPASIQISIILPVAGVTSENSTVLTY